MRLQHYETRLSHPFRLSTADELIDDALRGIVEVSKLSLPEDQGVGIGHRVSKFESKDTVLGQRAVADGVRCLVGVHVAQRPVSRLVHGLMVENVVSVREGASLDVLAGQSNVNSLLQE